MLILVLALLATACSESGGRVEIRPLRSTPEAGTALAVATIAAKASPTAAATPAPRPLALMLSFTFPVDNVSLEQANALMSGATVRWSELGGPDLPVRRVTWSDGAVRAVPSLSVATAATDTAGSAALLAVVATRPGTLALVPWDGPHLHSKALSVDGILPDDRGYPLQAAAAAPAPPPQTGSFSLAAAGDLMLGRRVALVAGDAVDYPLNRVRADFQNADIGFANLEVALTQRGSAAHKDYTFRAPPALAAGLRAAGINVLSLANNHVLDYGPTGLKDTVAALQQSGIAHAGAGSNAAAAETPAVLDIRGVRVAFLSFVNVPNDSVTGFVAKSMSAGPARPGVDWGTPEEVTRQVQAAKAHADVVIVSMHAGTEYADTPNAVQRGLAHAAIDAGAALVIGAHPHVLQGIEYYHRGVILYSLGNFVFDFDPNDVRNYGLAPVQTLVARVTFTADRVSGLQLLPAMINTSQYRPVPATGAAAQAVLDRVYRLTDALASQDAEEAPPSSSSTSKPPSR